MNTLFLVISLGRGEFGNCLGSLRNGVLGKFTWEHESDGSLNLAGGKGGLLVVSGELSGFSGDTFEDIVNEGVHDRHSLLTDTSIGVNLLQYLIDVRRVRLDALLASLFSIGLGNHFLCGCFGGCFGHDYLVSD